MRDKFENIGISDDFMFGTVMRNPEYCRPFLETVLGIQIEKIVYPSSQKVIDLKADARSIRLDVYALDENHRVFNIEMQTGCYANLPKRSRYYQGMVDLNILEKGKDYQHLRKSYIIFVCTFDLFGDGRHIYTFENRCVQNLDLALGDEAVKVFLNTKGTADDVSVEMKNLLDYIDGKVPTDTYTNALDEEVRRIRQNEDWRVDYMTLDMKFREKYEEGVEKGKQEGREIGKIDTLIQLVHDGVLAEEDAARRAEMVVEDFVKLI